MRSCDPSECVSVCLRVCEFVCVWLGVWVCNVIVERLIVVDVSFVTCVSYHSRILATLWKFQELKRTPSMTPAPRRWQLINANERLKKKKTNDDCPSRWIGAEIWTWAPLPISILASNTPTPRLAGWRHRNLIARKWKRGKKGKVALKLLREWVRERERDRS